MEVSSSTYNQAAHLLMERFPSLGLMLSSRVAKPVSEESAASFEIEKAEIFYFYGLGAGSIYFQCRDWLKALPERQLVFLEDDLDAIASFLYQREAVEILSDPQVHLESFFKEEEEIESLAKRFPLKRVEVSGLKSKKGLAALRLQLLRKTALSHALHIDRLHGYQPFRNFIENLSYLPYSFYANGLKDAFKGIPAVVCGAGPSLQDSIDELRNLEHRAIVIAGGSTLAALSSAGVVPHFAMAIDPNLEEYRRLKNSFAFEVPFLYSTRVNPAVFQTCNGPFGYMRSGIGGVPELWMEEELGLLDPFIGEILSSEASSVTAICIAWAQFLGCNPILINGVDMAYTNNKRYAAGVVEDEEISVQSIDKEKSSADQILRQKDRLGNPIFTAVRWVMESASISYFAKNHPDFRFINTTEGGIGFEGIDYVPLKDAVVGFQKKELRKLVYEQIAKNPMPTDTAAKIAEKIGELRESLSRLAHHLEVLSGEKKGSQALAEIELKDEIAYLYLFYDVYQILKEGPSFWRSWLNLVRKYEQVIALFNPSVK